MFPHLNSCAKYVMCMESNNVLLCCVPLQRADIAAAPLTISPVRKEFADFTLPIFDVHISFVYKKIPLSNIKTIDDLIRVPGVIFLLIPQSYFETFFKYSELPTAKMIWNNAQVCEIAIDLSRTHAILDRKREQLQYHPQHRSNSRTSVPRLATFKRYGRTPF